jgi:hypothetical protein
MILTPSPSPKRKLYKKIQKPFFFLCVTLRSFWQYLATHITNNNNTVMGLKLIQQMSRNNRLTHADSYPPTNRRVTGARIAKLMREHWHREHDIVLKHNVRDSRLVIEILPTHQGHPHTPFKAQDDYYTYLSEVANMINSHGLGEQLEHQISRPDIAPYVSFLPTSKRPIKLVLTSVQHTIHASI